MNEKQNVWQNNLKSDYAFNHSGQNKIIETQQLLLFEGR